MTLDLKTYYKIIQTKIQDDNFEVKFLTMNSIQDESLINFKEQCKTNSHLESIHYLMYDFWLDRKDQRIETVFDYICIPFEVNQGDMDIDFTQWSTEIFLEEIMKLKD
ncbi:MAG: hypothetical protein WC755_08310 [Candidatus Woesearchaeota archaeon]|jgi:hypothetical protein